MKLDKLFNVLVLGGAALGVAACGSDGDDTDKRDDPANTGDDDGEEATDDNGGDDQSGDGSDVSADGSGADGQTGDGSSDDDTTTEDDGTPMNDAAVAVDQDAGGATLICSESPSPGDPCGCPCCWSGGLNTDDSCMGFCEAGNNGKGCCDV